MRVEVDVALQRAERAVAEVEQDAPGAAVVLGLDAGSRTPATSGPGKRAGAADDGQPHRPATRRSEAATGADLGAEEPAAEPRERVAGRRW